MGGEKKCDEANWMTVLSLCPINSFSEDKGVAFAKSSEFMSCCHY